jgi:hypothetical protein
MFARPGCKRYPLRLDENTHLKEMGDENMHLRDESVTKKENLRTDVPMTGTGAITPLAVTSSSRSVRTVSPSSARFRIRNEMGSNISNGNFTAAGAASRPTAGWPITRGAGRFGVSWGTRGWGWTSHCPVHRPSPLVQDRLTVNAQALPLAISSPRVHTQGVAQMPPNRVFLEDVRGNDQYLRATWHNESATIVFSHWNGEVCMASTPVALTDCTKLIDLMVRSLSAVAERRVSPAEPPRPRSTISRLKDRLSPRLAEVIDASTRFLPTGRADRERYRSS